MTYEEFVDEHAEGLLRFATVLTGDPHLAEDLVQDTLIKTYRAWDKIAVLDRPVSYVRRMLVNEHVSWRRKWSRIVPTEQVERADSWEPDTATGVADRQEALQVIRALPARQQAAVALRYLDDLSVEQIAHVLHCRPASVRGYLSKALAALRTHATTVRMESTNP